MAATLGPSDDVAVALMDFGGLGVALPCASAKRSCLSPEVFDDFSLVGRMLSPCDRAIIREMNESVLAVFVLLSRAKRWSTPSTLSTYLASPALLHHLHSVISDFRPPFITESGEAALRRLLASRAIGGHSLTSEDPAAGSPTGFQSSRNARPQDALRAPTS